MKHTLVALVASAVLMAACSGGEPKQTAAPSASTEFAKFVDDYFDAAFQYSPSMATYVGVHDHDAKLNDLSRAAYEARIQQLHGFLDRLAAIDRGALGFDEQVDAEAMENEIRSSLYDMETLRGWEKNPMAYVWVPGGAIGGLIKRDFAPASERLASVTSRLTQVPAVFEAAKANVKNPPKEFTDLAIRMARGSVGYFEGTLAAWAKDAAGGDGKLLAEFEDANATAIAAAKSFAEWLESDLLPASRGDFAIGAEAFATKLRYEEMVTMPLAELLAIGEAQLEKDHQAFLETAKQIDPDKSPAEVMQSLSDEHPTAEDLIPSVRRTVEEARQFLVDHDIVTIPSEVRVTVAETPPYARSGSFASMDTPGPYETKATEAFYYVTPVEPEWSDERKEQHLRLYNPYVVAMINVHEAYPGHYLQFLYAPQFPTKVRKLVGAGTNSEGWAHYTEQMMWEQGFGGGNPKVHLAQLQEALLRDCRYVAGIKLHTEGWTVERAAKELFEDRCFQEPANAYEEARRGAYNPTYLYYTLGKIEIQRLRDEYMQKKGATLKQFHDAFVAQGALPIPLVRRILLER
jgi:uncharacterized protein (DUF885 family)